MAFEGKNKEQSLIKLSFERSKYARKAFPENGGLGQEPIVDFNFAERNLYGKVDRVHNPVIANQDYIVPLYMSRNNESVINVMNFVADQFNDFQTHYVRACRLNLVSDDDPVLSVIQAKRGYEDPMVRYEKYMDNVMITYVREFLQVREKRVVSFNDFVEVFLEFMERMGTLFPVTLSGFQRSRQSSIFTSGLVIDIGDIKFGNDEIKQDTFIDNPSFQFYINMAKQYGFSINKQNPGVMVADLAGPGCVPYRANYGLPTINSVFDKQFNKTINTDIEQLKFYFLEYYNTFVTLYPIHRIIETPLGRLCSKVTEREYINNINNNMNNKILYIYMKIRNIEEGKPYTKIELDNCYETAIRLKRISDNDMMEYIDKKFREKYITKSGSLSSIIKKQRKKLDNDT